MDVTDDESMQSGVAQILAEEGRIDVLVNAAGYGSYGALEDVPLSEARNQVEVNLFGAARLTQLVLPRMRDQRSGTTERRSSPPRTDRQDHHEGRDRPAPQNPLRRRLRRQAVDPPPWRAARPRLRRGDPPGHGRAVVLRSAPLPGKCAIAGPQQLRG